MSPLVGTICIFFIVVYLCVGFERILFSIEYHQERVKTVLFLDYYKEHYCESQIGKGSLVNYFNEKVVSVAKKVDDKWTLTLQKCLLIQE